MPCFAILAVGPPGYRFGLFGTACIVLLLRSDREPTDDWPNKNGQTKSPARESRPGFSHSFRRLATHGRSLLRCQDIKQISSKISAGRTRGVRFSASLQIYSAFRSD